MIVVLKLKISLTSCFNTKSSLIWLFKIYYWVVWQISVHILECIFWYILVLQRKFVLIWTYPCIYFVRQLDLYVWRMLIFINRGEVIITFIIRKSYTKVNFISSQLDSNVFLQYVAINVQVKFSLYDISQSTCMWKSTFTTDFVPRTSGSAFSLSRNIRIQCNSFLGISYNERHHFFLLQLFGTTC